MHELLVKLLNNNEDYIFISSDTTCPKKCNFQMHSLNSDDRYTYSLRRILLTIGDEINILNFCSEWTNGRTLHVNCAFWNESTSQIYILK